MISKGASAIKRIQSHDPSGFVSMIGVSIPNNYYKTMFVSKKLKKCFVCDKLLSPLNQKGTFCNLSCRRLFYNRAEAPENGYTWRGSRI